MALGVLRLDVISGPFVLLDNWQTAAPVVFLLFAQMIQNWLFFLSIWKYSCVGEPNQY